MIGKRYYITTLADWQRHAARFANSHWLALDDNADAAPPLRASARAFSPATSDVAKRAATPETAAEPTRPERHDGASVGAQHIAPALARDVSDTTRILVLVEADEGAHLALEDDAAFEPLPHPLAQQPISAAAQVSLARLGVAPGANTFDAAEAAARVHPLLRHRVF